MQNLENKDKILKIFSKVHCFNKDQLPRYVDGRLTHVEKHLLEQHLVNCELCSDAVQILQESKYKAQYQSMGIKVQQYIRKSSYIAPVLEAERYQKNVQIKENVLTYFWGAVAIALAIGCFFLVQRQVELENMHTTVAKTAQVIPPADQPVTDNKVLTVTSGHSAATKSVRDVQAMKPAEGDDAADEAALAGIAGEGTDQDKVLYKTAMTYYYQGQLDEAMPRLTKLTSDTTSRYRELAHYQLAMCFKYKRQKAKARNMFKELVSMNGRMKKRAQTALTKL
ncbi:zf-HC2 domain-containing protein [Chitinophaga rhizophila]|uniref:Zf-HC2 domain-containing protein n=1 Tax=Chitinophaga rhizophila TaxID=2866212 RepID=A0ABS7G8Z1_9BACT|nr:zf-HC2 domain-containing protein [Chitinophaga rhizophila]MBW8683162.1 zf-HC2 domain-containing protein [Chitinophaga rhizophila]